MYSKIIYSLGLFLSMMVFSQIVEIQEAFKPYLKDQKALRIYQNSLKPTEELLFDIDWGFINAGQAMLELLQTDDDSLLIIRSRAWCNKLFQSFYPVQDTIFSIIDKKGFYPLRYEKRIHEGSYHSNILIRFDQKNKKVYTKTERLKKPIQDTTFHIPQFTHDILSSFYFMRMIDFKVGDTVSINVVSGSKQYPLEIICHRKEFVKVPIGRFEAFVIEPRIKGVGLFNTKGTLNIWITADSNKIPVKMKTEIPVGSIQAKLVKITKTFSFF